MDGKYNSKYKPMILGPGFQSEPDISKWFHYSVLDGAGGRIWWSCEGTEQHVYIFRRFLLWWVFVQCISKKGVCALFVILLTCFFGLVVSKWISWFFLAGWNQIFVQKYSTSKCKQCSPVFEDVNKFCQFQLVPKLLNSSIQVPGVLPLQYFAPFFRATSRPSLAESHGLGDLVGNTLLVHGCTIYFFVICVVK